MLKKNFLILLIGFTMIIASNKVFATEIINGKLVDQQNFSIAIKEYKRIVIIDSAIAENAYMINAVNNVVGVANTRSPLYKDNAILKMTSDVGNYHLPSIETIISLKPDLVILSKNNDKLGKKLQNTNIAVINFDYNEINDIFKNARLFAKLVNKEQETENLIKIQEAKLQKIKANPLSNIKGALIYSANPIIAYNANTFVGQILNLIGVENIAEKASGNQSTLSIEYILNIKPDFLITMSKGSNVAKDYPLLANIPASENNHIFIITPSQIAWGSLHVIDNIVDIYNNLITVSQYKKEQNIKY